MAEIRKDILQNQKKNQKKIAKPKLNQKTVLCGLCVYI